MMCECLARLYASGQIDASYLDWVVANKPAWLTQEERDAIVKGDDRPCVA